MPLAATTPDPASGKSAPTATDQTVPTQTVPTNVRPTRLTPGGSALAALLTSNRAKTGRSDSGGDGGPIPRPRRTTPSGATFDLLDITAVGGAAAKKSEAGESRGSGAIRATRLTPAGGGLPALLAAAGRAAAKVGDGDGDAKATTTPLPTRATPTASGFESQDVITAVGGGVVDKAAASGDTNADATGVDVVGPEGASVGGETSTAAGVASGAVAAAAGGAVKDPNAPRPTRLTPGSAGLAALLAQTRSRTGKHDILDRKAAVAVAASTSDSGPTAVPSGADRAAEPATSAVVASQPEKKRSSFAATLMGVPAPEIKISRPASGHANGASYVPQSVDHGEPTEKNLEVSGDARDSTRFRPRAGSDQRHRTTELVDVVPPRRKPPLVVGTMVAAAVVLIAAVVVVPRMRKQPEPGTPDARARTGASPTEALPVAPPPALPAAPADDPAAADPSATAGEKTTPAPTDLTAKPTEDEVRQKARAEAAAAKVSKAEAREKARADVKAALVAKAEAKAEAKKQARAEAMAALAAKAEAKKQARAEAKVAKAGKDETEKQARVEAKAAKAEKAEAQKQARADAKAAKVAKAEAQKQARAEARAAREAKGVEDSGPAGTRPGLPWENSSAEASPGVATRPDLRKPASVTEAPRPKASVPARPIEDPDATLPLSTR